MIGFSINIWNRSESTSTANTVEQYMSYEFDTNSAKFYYTLGLQWNTQCLFNDIKRSNTGTLEDVILKTTAIESGLSSLESFNVSMDVYPTGNSDAYYCLGLDSFIGTGISDLEFAVRCWRDTDNTIYWESYEDGVKTADLTTTISVQKVGLLFEYDGDNELKVYINNNLEHTFITDFSSEELALKFLGYKANSPICAHLGIIKNVPLSFNHNLVAIGDSITFGNAAFNVDCANYIRLANKAINYKYNICPILALSGTTVSAVKTTQALWAQKYYNGSNASNVVTMMIGTNDLITGQSLLSIQNNMNTSINTVRGYGFHFVLCTVIKDWANDPVDRYTLNAWIKAGNTNADTICDFADTELETNQSLYRADDIHPNESGMEILGIKLYDTLKTI